MKVALMPFAGAAIAVVPIPELAAMIRFVGCTRTACGPLPTLPDGNVPVIVFVETDGVDRSDPDALRQYLMERKQALVDETRRLLIAPTFLN
jgi:hypothetical protein